MLKNAMIFVTILFLLFLSATTAEFTSELSPSTDVFNTQYDMPSTPVFTSQQSLSSYFVQSAPVIISSNGTLYDWQISISMPTTPLLSSPPYTFQLQFGTVDGSPNLLPAVTRYRIHGYEALTFHKVFEDGADNLKPPTNLISSNELYEIYTESFPMIFQISIQFDTLEQLNYNLLFNHQVLFIINTFEQFSQYKFQIPPPIFIPQGLDKFNNQVTIKSLTIRQSLPPDLPTIYYMHHLTGSQPVPNKNVNFTRFEVSMTFPSFLSPTAQFPGTTLYVTMQAFGTGYFATPSGNGVPFFCQMNGIIVGGKLEMNSQLVSFEITPIIRSQFDITNPRLLYIQCQETQLKWVQIITNEPPKYPLQTYIYIMPAAMVFNSLSYVTTYGGIIIPVIYNTQTKLPLNSAIVWNSTIPTIHYLPKNKASILCEFQYTFGTLNMTNEYNGFEQDALQIEFPLLQNINMNLYMYPSRYLSTTPVPQLSYGTQFTIPDGRYSSHTFAFQPNIVSGLQTNTSSTSLPAPLTPTTILVTATGDLIHNYYKMNQSLCTLYYHHRSSYGNYESQYNESTPQISATSSKVLPTVTPMDSSVRLHEMTNIIFNGEVEIKLLSTTSPDFEIIQHPYRGRYYNLRQISNVTFTLYGDMFINVRTNPIPSIECYDYKGRQQLLLCKIESISIQHSNQLILGISTPMYTKRIVFKQQYQIYFDVLTPLNTFEVVSNNTEPSIPKSNQSPIPPLPPIFPPDEDPPKEYDTDTDFPIKFNTNNNNIYDDNNDDVENDINTNQQFTTLQSPSPTPTPINKKYSLFATIQLTPTTYNYYRDETMTGVNYGISFNYNGQLPPSTRQGSNPQNRGKLSSGAIIGIAVGCSVAFVFFFILFICLCCHYCACCKSKPKTNNYNNSYIQTSQGYNVTSTTPATTSSPQGRTLQMSLTTTPTLQPQPQSMVGLQTYTQTGPTTTYSYPSQSQQQQQPYQSPQEQVQPQPQPYQEQPQQQVQPQPQQPNETPTSPQPHPDAGPPNYDYAKDAPPQYE